MQFYTCKFYTFLHKLDVLHVCSSLFHSADGVLFNTRTLHDKDFFSVCFVCRKKRSFVILWHSLHTSACVTLHTKVERLGSKVLDVVRIEFESDITFAIYVLLH